MENNWTGLTNCKNMTKEEFIQMQRKKSEERLARFRARNKANQPKENPEKEVPKTKLSEKEQSLLEKMGMRLKVETKK
jgi:hypothetical protein